jgi:hypothetical protein
MRCLVPLAAQRLSGLYLRARFNMPDSFPSSTPPRIYNVSHCGDNQESEITLACHLGGVNRHLRIGLESLYRVCEFSEFRPSLKLCEIIKGAGIRKFHG